MKPTVFNKKLPGLNNREDLSLKKLKKKPRCSSTKDKSKPQESKEKLNWLDTRQTKRLDMPPPSLNPRREPQPLELKLS